MGNISLALNTKVEWLKSHPSTYYSSGNFIKTDANGNIYTFGYFKDSVDFDPSSNVFWLSSTGTRNADLYLSKLDKDGNFIWARQFGGTDTERPHDLEIDDAGNIYLFGEFKGTGDFDPGPQVFNLSTTVWECSFMCKLNSQGNFIWAKQFSGPGANGIIDAKISTDSSVYVTGTFSYIVDFDPDTGSYSLTSSGDRDIFNAKYNSNGDLVWVHQIGGTAGDQGIYLDLARNIH